ncbi:hypothetical protein [Segatella buccae]
MKLYIVDLFFASLTLVSCQISGLTSGYSHLTKKEQEKIVNYKGKIADIHDFSNIYTVTVEQVKEFLSKNEKVLVYDYTPYYNSSYCVSPTALADICKAKQANLLVISNIYDDIFLAVNKNFPILMIDTEAYKTNRRSKYIESFYSSLIGRRQKDIDYASYHYFYNGTYVRSCKDFKDISKVGL